MTIMMIMIVNIINEWKLMNANDNDNKVIVIMWIMINDGQWIILMNK